METIINNIIGVVISLFFYLLGYRQTIGAKKERILSANSEVEKILIRRIVMENYEINNIDITRLLFGKARDFKVKVSELLSQIELLNTIFTRLLETDFITKEQRESVLARIQPLMDEAENKMKMNEEELYLEKGEKKNYQPLLSLLVPFMAILFGGIASFLIGYKETLNNIDINTEQLTTIIFPTVATSVLLISVISVFRKFKEGQQEVTISSRSIVMEEAIKLEREVAKELKKYNKIFNITTPHNKRFDFLLDNNGKKIIIEVKLFRKEPPTIFIKNLIDRFNASVEEENALEGIIVTKMPIDLSEIDIKDFKIKIMTLDELKKYQINTDQ